ncbi:MAG TPA: hypothetical protein DCQ06_10485, partial [Myxococcales bacterium]|nr:hypothetical protein [Myxococcales bacterium]
VKLNSRLGELAVRCSAGYVSKTKGEFVALLMGITRGVKLMDDKTPVQVEVWLDTPLTREVVVTLDAAPTGPLTVDQKRLAKAWLDLEGEGVFVMAEAESTELVAKLTLTGLPSQLQGNLKQQPWVLYGGLVNEQDSDWAPYTVSIDKDAQMQTGERVSQWLLDAKVPVVGQAWVPEVYAMARGQAGLFAVGAEGRILRWAAGGFTTQQSPTTAGLMAVWLDSKSADGWIGGKGGVLLRRDPVTGWQSWPSPTAADIIDLMSVNDVIWLLTAEGKIWRRSGADWQPIPVPAGAWKAFALQQVQGVGGAASVTVTTLWLVGAAGAALHGTLIGANTWTWQSLVATSGAADYHDVQVAADRVWIVGSKGTVAWIQGSKISTVKTPSTGTLYSAQVQSSGELIAVGDAGRWVVVGLDGAVQEFQVSKGASDLRALIETPTGWLAAGVPSLRLGPILPMPYLTKPTNGMNITDEVSWTVESGPSAELQRVQITNFWRQNYWTLYGRGDITSVPLANFPQLGGWQPLPDGPLRVRVWRALGPSLQLDNFNHQELSPAVWRSWSMNWLMSQK